MRLYMFSRAESVSRITHINTTSHLRPHTDRLEVWVGGRVCRVVGRRTRTNRLEVHQLSDGALLGNDHLVHAKLQISSPNKGEPTKTNENPDHNETESFNRLSLFETDCIV